MHTQPECHPDLIDSSDAWDTIPARSKLYNLEPIGMDDHRRESLLSYLIRLARAHHVSPRQLLKHVFSKVDNQIPNLCYNRFFVTYIGTTSGLGPYSRMFARAANILTARTDLEGLTMLPWYDVIPEKSEGLIGKFPKWCPCCFAEQIAKTGETYTPLSWSLQLYKTCTTHLCPLRERCQHCRKQQAFLPSFPDASRCCHCGESLAAPLGTLGDEDRTYFDLSGTLTEQTLESMLCRHDDAASNATRNNFCRSLERLVDTSCSRNRAQFCRMMGWNIWALNGWLNKGEKVTFPKLVEISIQFKINPVDFCSLSNRPINPGSEHPALDRAPDRIVKRAARPRLTRPQRLHLERDLRDQLKEKLIPLSLRETGLQTSLSSSALKYWFPDICMEICERWTASRKARAAEAQIHRETIISGIVQSLFAQGIYPSKRKMDAVMKGHGLALARPELLRVYHHYLKSSSGCPTALTSANQC